jgi:hypothetical protein
MVRTFVCSTNANRSRFIEDAVTGVVKGVVAAVRGDRAEGEDGELYCAMGYIPTSRRKRSSAQSRKEESPSRDSDTG